MHEYGRYGVLPAGTNDVRCEVDVNVLLSVIFIIVLFALGASEYRLNNERTRFLVQIGIVTVLMLF
jgi:hypothetical protein